MDKRDLIRVPARVCLAGEGCDWMLSKAACWSFPAVDTAAQVLPDRGHPESDITIAYTASGHTEVLRAWPRPDTPLSYAAACLLAVRKRLAPGPRGSLIRLSSTIPTCGGLSSSAALCVALVKAMAVASDSALPDEEVAEAAYEAEQLMKIPCGRMDQYSVQNPAPIVIDSSVFPPSITPLTLCGKVTIVAAYQRQSSCSFAEQYPDIRRRWEENEERVLRYIREIAQTCEALADASLKRTLDVSLLGRIVMQAHMAIIEHLGKENTDIDPLVDAALRAGALGAKSCGARQRGGAMIAICEPNKAEEVARSLTKMRASVIVNRYGE